MPRDTNNRSIGPSSPALLDLDRFGNPQGIERADGYASLLSGGLRTVLIGHSYIDAEHYTAADGRTLINFGGSVAWANVLMGHPLKIIKDMGIGGERITDVLARISYLAQYEPQVIICSIGTNDLKNTVNAGVSPITGVAYAADSRQVELPYVIEKYDELIGYFVATGAMVFLMGESSPANGAADQTKHLAARTVMLNRWLQRRCSLTRNMYYLPVDRVMYDNTSTAGDVVSGYYGTSDNIHPSPLSAYYRGRKMATIMSPLLRPFTVDRLPWNVFDTHENLKIAGTAITGNDTTVTLTCANASGSNKLMQAGDTVTVGGPSGHTEWNGTFVLTAATTTTVSWASTVSGSWTGTFKACMAEQLFRNPLLLTQTGGSAITGGGTLTSGVAPLGFRPDLTAGSSVIITYAAHTDLAGAADGIGSWAEFNLTLAANGTFTLRWDLQSSNPASGTYAQVMPGDCIYGAADFELLGTPTPSGIFNLQFGIEVAYNDTTGAAVSSGQYEFYRLGSDTTNPHPNQPFRGAFETAEWKMPTGALVDLTTFYGSLLVKAGASGATCKVRIGRIGCYRLNTPDRNSTECVPYQ